MGASPEPPLSEAAIERLARGHRVVQRLLADEEVPAHSRLLYKEMYFAMGDSIMMDDLVMFARVLQRAKDTTAAAT